MLAPFSDESRVAPHVVGMLLPVAVHVGGARSVGFLLVRISTAEVIRVLGPPMPIQLLLLLLATLGLATGLLPLFEARMGMKPATTERTPPPWEHTFLLQEKQSEEVLKKKEKSKRERLFRMDQRKKQENQKHEEQLIFGESRRYWPVNP